MMKDNDLKAIHRKVYMAYFQDGWWDILLGLFLVSWGLVFLTDVSWLPTISFIALYSVTWPMKRWLTYPRIGHARIAEEKRQKSKLLILGSALFLFGLMAFFLFIGGNRPQWVSDYFYMLFGGMVAVVIAILAYWWQVNRWYGYAILLILGASLYQWLGLPLPLSFIVPGATIAAAGIYLLVRFLKKYPRATDAEKNGEAYDGGR